MEQAADRLRSVVQRTEQAAHRAGRNPQEIVLVAVTKTVPLDHVLPFIQAGIRRVGENRVQEALTKYSTPLPLGGEGLGEGFIRPEFHLIGPLQSNKAKKAIAFFDVIQSLDRWDLAEDLNRHAQAIGKVQDCLIEVKVSEEPSKSGLLPEAFPDFLSRLSSLPNLRVRGLMGIPPLAATGDAARPYFQCLQRLFQDSCLEVLSMGMSSDFEVAIEEGSTMVRIGSALFGPRP
jgi:pyridoxal phosphate enzyme (YggS family)